MDITGKIDSMLVEKRHFSPSQAFRKNAHIGSYEEYQKRYQQSIKDPEQFWGTIAKELEWYKPWRKVFASPKKPFVQWFVGGKTNVCANCLDRHLTTKVKDKIAILWEGENGEKRSYTYEQLHREVCRFANLMKAKNITKGDRVCIYMPMIPELAIAMLACARVGAIHSVIFGGFSAASIKKRAQDSEAAMIITADGGFRHGKVIPLKPNVDDALQDCPSVKKVIVFQWAKNKVAMKKGRDSWWHEEINQHQQNGMPKPEPMDAEDPLFILYTSGTTGNPKGVIHATGGYMVYAYLTTKYIFDLKDNDIHWCTADCGWVTGHTYLVYGPLLNGATTVMFEGVPNYPQPDRFWEIVERYKVTIFYTAPTAIRAMMKDGDTWPKKHNLSSLRLLGSVGEPINPEAWMWYYTVIGNKKCPIVDTWWQTETGGILITPLPGAIDLKPGSATLPFFGIEPAVLKEDGSEAGTNEGGYLVIKNSWPAIARSVWKDPERYVKTYFSKFKNMYLTGDGAKKDENGYFWIMGRIDDVVNVSGHRIGTAEVESALVSHTSVAEAAVVPMPHNVKGQALYAFVTLKTGKQKSDKLKEELSLHVRKEIGPIAQPDKIQFADSLPKTRSGKIMRRILRAIAEGSTELGDTTTLADPSVVEQLLKERQ
ncbi:acetate--CoA ligase [Candidatus Woesearchaeota archaeon]|nr:acetate--CoA ligase [Candidatus Woesearchaeota archaeon]